MTYLRLGSDTDLLAVRSDSRTMSDQYKCPICLTPMQQPAQQISGGEHIVCPRCGEYQITRRVKTVIQKQLESDHKARAVLSHAVRRMQEASPAPPLITDELANQLLQSGSLPSPAQQAENLILWLGGNLVAPGETVELDSRPLTAIIGAIDESGVEFILDHRVRVWVIWGHFRALGAGK